MVSNPMWGPNPFKLGTFSMNGDGGLALTTVAEEWSGSWDDIQAMAAMTDRAGFEFLLPIARWKGYKGATNPRANSFETLTHAAALAMATKRMAIFSTVHVPIVHPVFAAKALTTIDHASHGRAGLNIVCGWNKPEFDMFGHVQIDHDKRYAQGHEWYDIVQRVWDGQSFDFRGAFYSLKEAEGGPPPCQQPRPVVMSAAFSPAGRDFAAATSDFLFTTFMDIDTGKAHILDIQDRARALGKDALPVFTTCHVVCRETDREAEDYYRYYAEEKADHAAVDHIMALRQEFSQSHDDAVYRMHRRRFAGGVGSYGLIGSPEKIVAEMTAMHRAGFAGTTVSFVNFLEELPFFIDRVLPLMRQAGLRVENT